MKINLIKSIIKTIFFSIILILNINILSAQSKKELDLRIDTLQTVLNNEKQVVQNLTVQIQNLTSEMDKTNKSLTFLSSQMVKQDSMNNSLLVQLKTASIEADSLTLFVLSSVKKPIFPDNLLIDITGLYENCLVYPTQKVNTNLNELQMLDIFNEPYTCLEKGNIETIGSQTKQWYRINENINENLAQGWVLGINFIFLQPDINANIADYGGIYEMAVPHPVQSLVFVEVNNITQEITVKTMGGRFDNGNITFCGGDDLKTNDFSSAITLKNSKISGCSLTSESGIGWFAKAEDPAKKIKTVKGIIWGGAFYRKVK